MKISSNPLLDGWSASEHELTKEFMEHYVALCRQYNMVIVPFTYPTGIDFHDTLQVVPLEDESYIDYVKKSVVNIEE